MRFRRTRSGSALECELRRPNTFNVVEGLTLFVCERIRRYRYGWGVACVKFLANPRICLASNIGAWWILIPRTGLCFALLISLHYIALFYSSRVMIHSENHSRVFRWEMQGVLPLESQAGMHSAISLSHEIENLWLPLTCFHAVLPIFCRNSFRAIIFFFFFHNKNCRES